MKLNDFSWYEYPGTTAEPPRPRSMEDMQSDLDAMSVAMFVMMMIVMAVLGTSK